MHVTSIRSIIHVVVDMIVSHMIWATVDRATAVAAVHHFAGRSVVNVVA